MKIVRLFEDDMLSVEQECIKHLGMAVEFEVKPSTTEAEVIENAKDADIIITVYEPLTRHVLENLPKLKLVIYRSIGFNTIDMDYANQINLPVSHISKYCVDEVANYVVAAILSHNRRLIDFNHSVKVDRKWDYELFPDIRRLSTQTIGLIGLGNIPKLVAERLKVFGPRVIAYDPFVEDAVFEKHGIEKVSLKEIFLNSDYISSHLPLNDSTSGILNKELFEQVKPGAVFINSSRGGVVNEDDLYQALTQGNLAYAILDVLSTETPNLDETPLVKLNNVVVTPHIAFYSQDAFVQAAQDTLKNIDSFLKGNVKDAEIVNLKHLDL
ncbi:C-terminal binding protein [Streptococcus phocae subsp. phocae]